MHALTKETECISVCTQHTDRVKMGKEILQRPQCAEANYHTPQRGISFLSFNGEKYWVNIQDPLQTTPWKGNNFDNLRHSIEQEG